MCFHGVGTFCDIRIDANHINAFCFVVLGQLFHAFVVGIRHRALHGDEDQNGAVLSIERAERLFFAIRIRKREIIKRRTDGRWRRHITFSGAATYRNNGACKQERRYEQSRNKILS